MGKVQKTGTDYPKGFWNGLKFLLNKKNDNYFPQYVDQHFNIIYIS